MEEPDRETGWAFSLLGPVDIAMNDHVTSRIVDG
jgi:hypothetical protein